MTRNAEVVAIKSSSDHFYEITRIKCESGFGATIANSVIGASIFLVPVPIFNRINEKMRHSQCYYRENNLARNTWVEALVVRDNKQ